ncbi:amino acid ABC transporter permease [Methylobacterium tarhaniae]|uniref:Amino acid ABC transporter permease n=1 Tax=Methylobacterium tarhaniae TaxID=1187852 RepID=A0A0J6TFZ6_9HYPH|nr:ABC transporter permease subunit [Methylobacterium tarhaniae]KMO44623.1 amino acid ABC transporter permease [Methylobacterium tarhaniae]
MEALTQLARGVPWTIALTLTSFLLGALLGLGLCALRLSSSRVLRALATGAVLLLRSVPPVVWLFIIFFGIGFGYVQLPSFLAAMLGLALITAANMAEIYRGALSGVHRGQTEAAIALGLSPRHRFQDIVGPQMIRIALPSAATFAIGLLKDTSVASLIGVQDVAFQVNALAQRSFSGTGIFVIAALLYIALSLPIAALARWTDLRLRAKVAR